MGILKDKEYIKAFRVERRSRKSDEWKRTTVAALAACIMKYRDANVVKPYMPKLLSEGGFDPNQASTYIYRLVQK